MGVGLREVLASFTFDVDDTMLTKADRQVDGFMAKLRRIGEVAAGAFALRGVTSFFDQQIERAARIQDLSNRLDIAADSLRGFELVAGTAGLGIEEAGISLGRLERAAGDARLGGKDTAQAFGQLGVSLSDATGKAKPLDEMLGEIADGFQRLPDQQTKAITATRLFGREGLKLVPILEQGRAKIDELQAEAKKLGNGLGQDFYQRAQQARFAVQRFDLAFQSLKDRITSAALPGITDVLHGLEHLAVGAVDLTKHTHALETGMDTLAILAGGRLLISVKDLARAFGLLKPSVLETIGALLEFAAPAIIVGALYLIFDDLYTLMKGGNSVIGETIDNLFGVGTAAKGVLYVKAAFEDLIDIIKDAGDAAKKTLGFILGTVSHLSKAFGSDVLGDFGAADKEIDAIGSDYAAASKDVSKDILGEGKASHIDQLQALLGAGIDPKSLLAGSNDKTLQARTGQGGVREPFDIVRHEPRIREPVGFSRVGAPQVVQHLKQEITVAAPSGTNPRDFARVISDGTAKPTEIAARNALAALNAP